MSIKTKVICFVLTIVFTFCIVGCAASWNQSMGWGNYSYTHAYIGIGSEGRCVNVKSWHDNDIGVEIELTNGGNLYCSEGTYILIKEANTCPFCH